MDFTKENIKPNPREAANFLSVLVFAYTARMFKKGYTKVLEVKDLYRPLHDDTSGRLGDKLERVWDSHVAACKSRNKKPSLTKVLAKTFWSQYLYLAVLLVLMDVVLRLAQPTLLGKLLDHFRKDSNVSRKQALWYAAGVGFIDVCVAVLMNQFMMEAFHYGMNIRTACCALIYRKSLRLSRTALGDTASGKIVNLLANDVSRFDFMSVLVNYMWVAPLVGIIVMYLMYLQCGIAAIIGLLPFFIFVPLQSYIGKLSAIYRKHTAQKTDERIRLIDEIISGIQVIKMYAWEIPFTKLIRWARKQEVKILTKSSYVRGVFMTFRLFTTRMALFCTLLTMVLTDQTITAAKVFVFTLYFNELSHSIATMFVRVIQEFAEFIVSIKRIEEFLMNEEFEEKIKPIENGIQNVAQDTAVAFKQVTVKWNIDAEDSTLTDLTLKFVKGRLYGIIGPVGSGKSSLLQTILGELPVANGTMNINGTLSYASQEPWLFGGTVRQNILFGEPYDKARYNEVIKVCALETDFKQFEQGDLTLIGDRGGSLSGGQKARINLARAVYRDADIYLLDDPLSAVDVHVAKHLFEKCITGYLAKKTRILVTHQVHLLTTVDQVIIFNEGKVEEQGTFAEVSSSSNAYTKGLMNDQDIEEGQQGDRLRRVSSISLKGQRSKKISQDSTTMTVTLAEPEDDDVEEYKLIENSTVKKRIRTQKISMSGSISELSSVSSFVSDDSEDDHIMRAQEESSKGKVKGSLFWNYHRAGGNICFCLIVLVFYLLAQIAASSNDYFVGFWTNVEEYRSEKTSNSSRLANSTDFNNLTDSTQTINSTNFTNSTKLSQDIYNLPFWSTEHCLYIYGTIVAILFFVGMTRSFLFFKLAMLASQKLHDKLFNNVLYTNMRFFATNPSGRIMNRFSKDIGGIDEHLPKALLDAGQIILQLAGSLVLIIIVNPYFLILVGILCIIFWFIRVVFLKTSKNIKRLEGIMKGPVFTHLNATLQGLPTIRAFGVQQMLKVEFDNLQDHHTSAWFMYITASSAFGFISDFFCSSFTVVVTFTLLCFGDNMLAGQVGLAITQAVSLTGLIQWGMRQSAEIVNQLISVERVLEYDTLPTEKQPDEPVNASKEWPDKGHIHFKDMGLKYDEDGPLVLKDLNIVIHPKEKVGIVGRTGAGKSSLISALFRLADVDGDIVIDDINTKDLVLQELRSRISIIPQDPVLFSGTLRYNLDPFEEYPDADLYKAIEEVELKDPNNIINKLENRVMDRGSNYSVGQRQLICLARALIRKNKILMLDEATANVDPQTDALIQKTIRDKFTDCTVLTVAHRLNTIMDSDKVLVMDAGTALEFDHPHLLLQNKDGRFYNMVMRTGPHMSGQLRNIAKQYYEKTHPSTNL